MVYDIIGDVHGMSDALKRLLKKLGYEKKNGIYSHPENRKVIFVGDLIDRGKNGVEVVQIAKSMTENGSAITVMGNHEFNAICYHTPNGNGDYLRPHNDKNTEQHEAFLKDIKNQLSPNKTLKEIIAWFKTLPVFYENKDFRVVHACWDNKSINALQPFLSPSHALLEDTYRYASEKGHAAYKAIETLLKGDEVTLPDDMFFYDKSGHKRHEARLRWWLDDTATFKEAAMFQGSKDVVKKLAEQMPDEVVKDRVIYTDDKPVFVGHYWFSGEPSIASDKVCCVDYSAGRGHKLCAYRNNDRIELENDNFITVNVAL